MADLTKRLLVIGPTPPPYHGVAVATENLLRSCIREKLSLAHLDLSDRRGIKHVNKPDINDLFLFLEQLLRLFWLLIRVRPCMTYLAINQTRIGFLRDSLLIWPSYLCGSRIIIHLHAGSFRSWYEGENWVMKAYVRTVLKRVARTIVLGESLRGIFEGLVPLKRITVVPNGVDWHQGERTHQCREAHGRFRILHFGTLNRLKGTLVLIRAVPLVVADRQDVEFVVAGSWSHVDHEQEALSFIQKNDLDTFVTFQGEVGGIEKQRLFETSDLFVFAGIQEEGQPLVVIEAMAAGLPIVFTNRGCLRETVINGENGIQVAINDPIDLARQILRLLENPYTMKCMGLASKRRYERFYTLNRHVDHLMHVFLSVAGQSTGKLRTVGGTIAKELGNKRTTDITG